MENNLLEEIRKAQQEIKRLKLSLRAEKLRTKISSEYTNFGLWEYDIATDICYQYKKLSGRYEDNLEPIVHFRDSIISWGIVCTEDLPAFNRFCDAMARGDKEITCDIRAMNDNYEMIWLRYEGKTAYDDDGKPVKVIGRTIDITDEKGGAETSAEGKDPLTGTYSPQLFRDCVLERRNGVNRYKDAALISVGIDKFREVMAEQGTEYSDYVQKTVSKMLEDIRSLEHDGIISRVRDGEFLIYLSFTNIAALNDTARRIIRTIGDYIFEGVSVTVSVGLSLFKNGRRLDEVYSESSAALAEAQKSGGACFMHYSAAMSAKKTSNTSAEAANLSGGAAKVYDLIIRAFCNENERPELLKSAFRAAGQCLGASNIYVFNSDNGKFRRYMTYSATGIDAEKCPCIVQSCSDEDIRRIFAGRNKLRLHTAGEKINGLSLGNGAVCAECRAIRCNGEVAEYFAVVFDSGFELSAQDLDIIDGLANALSEMYTMYMENRAGARNSRFKSTIISNHRMEGFTIIPGSFEVDLVGKNAADHYGMRSGDVCYKKMRGRSEPCVNCPALQLDRTDKLFASSAYYDENDRRWLDVTASVEENSNGERRYVISSTDITDCLGKIQMSDSLTGVMTFDVFTAEALKLTSSNTDNETGRFVAVVNVADFRRINEEKGYETGNSILVAIADIMQRCIGNGELLGRSEGSRFAALFKNVDADELIARLYLMMNSIQKQIYEKLHTQIYLLVGVCDMNEDPVGVMGALDRAIIAQKTIRDRAYYHENLVVFYDGAMREKIKERRHIEANMITALENDEFKVFYQPKVNIETGRVVGAEALVRWIRPDGEIISPGKFVPIFEENGFITEMDFAIYRSAVADMRRWLREGLEVPLVSLNVSRHHLADDNFCEKLNALVDNLGVPHELIELEITESLLTEHLDKLVETVTWFKDRGFRISVDDFGSGYSSLNLITMLPFDTLKIDGGFFLRNDLTEKNKKVITSVVTLAKSLNLATVSEGVETQVQVDFLKDLGCDMIQGFFYYKPMPSEDFHKLLMSSMEASKTE
ncbi:MAG: EAL domain-containing protein [Oscillospiraceae bacterium]|nr:EAL domain-containing protein [Oscillospiraceae bacterium]